MVADGGDMVIANSGAPSARVNVQQQSMRSSMTLASGCPVASSGRLLSVEPLYWYTSMNQEKSYSLDISNTYYGQYDFPWAWGVRAAVGINMGHDQWDSQLLYTGFWPKNNRKSNLSTGTLVEHQNKISYNMFDVELGKWFLFSKNIRARPYTGIKAGWVDQKIGTRFSSALFSAFSIENSRSNFAGVGAEGGIRTQWNLLNRDIHSFSLLGDLSAALMYGHWSNRQSSEYISTSSEKTSNCTGIDSNGLALMASGGVGFAWDVAIKDGDSHFAMDLTYQFQYWPSLSQLNAGITVPADLSFQGLGLKFRYDF